MQKSNFLTYFILLAFTVKSYRKSSMSMSGVAASVYNTLRSKKKLLFLYIGYLLHIYPPLWEQNYNILQEWSKTLHMFGGKCLFS